MLIARLIADHATLESALDTASAALADKGWPVAEATMLDFCGDVLQISMAGGDAAQVRAILSDAFAPSDLLLSAGPIVVPHLFVSDMDSTMIGQECIDELAAEVGLKPKVAEITARAMNGEIEFEPALRERVALLKGLPLSVIGDVIEKRITLAAGGPELVATMRANGAYTALVSGGFTLFTGPVAEKIGFDEHRSNILETDGDVLSGTVSEPILGKQAKVDALVEITERLGISTDEAIAVGDGANDLGMLELAGSGVAVHAKPSVAAQARFRIDHGDLTALLYLQGYRKTDFVT